MKKYAFPIKNEMKTTKRFCKIKIKRVRVLIFEFENMIVQQLIKTLS